MFRYHDAPELEPLATIENYFTKYSIASWITRVTKSQAGLPGETRNGWTRNSSATNDFLLKPTAGGDIDPDAFHLAVREKQKTI